MGMVAILIMWPASCHQIFISLYLKAFIKIWFRPAKKIRFEFLYVHTLAQGQKMTLTFNTHIPSYIQLDDCSSKLSGHWLQ